MKKNNNEDNFIDFNKINDLIKRIEIKYLDFKDYFSEDYNEYLKNNLKLTSNENNIDLQLGMQIENLTLKYLCDLTKDDNIEVLILLIDKFSPLLRTIKKYGKLKSEINDEDLLINAFENYNGDKLFSLHLSSCYKNMFKEDFFDKVKRYAVLENSYKTKIDEIIRILDVYNCDLEIDDNLKKFIYLKFGYYNDYYFSLDSIVHILEVDISTVLTLYKKSLLLAKEVSNSYIEDLSGKAIKKVIC